MKSTSRIALVIVLACGSRMAVSPSVGAQARAVLSAGPIAVEVLEAWTPPRLNDLRVRLQRAAQADPAWFQEHVRRATPGEPLPYDRRLGLTEREYKDFLLLTDSIQMRPARTETLVIEPTAVGWRFGAATTLSALRGIEMDTVRNQVHSSFGDLLADDPITPGPAQRATGRWGGPRWSLESIDSSTRSGASAAFAVGKHESTGRTIIYFSAQRVTSGQLTTKESLFLRFAR